MKIQPKTEDELKRAQLCPEGFYPFTVLVSEEKASKSAKNPGKMMFALKLNVHGPEVDYHVYDYFADWFMEHKLRHFANCIGKLDDYEGGEFDGANNCLQGAAGYVELAIEDAKGGYGPKNTVIDYVTEAEYKERARTSQEPTKAKEPAQASKIDDDDVPF